MIQGVGVITKIAVGHGFLKPSGNGGLRTFLFYYFFKKTCGIRDLQNHEKKKTKDSLIWNKYSSPLTDSAFFLCIIDDACYVCESGTWGSMSTKVYTMLNKSNTSAIWRETSNLTYPIVQAPPVTNATTGFRPSVFFGKYRSNLPYSPVFIYTCKHVLLAKKKHVLIIYAYINMIWSTKYLFLGRSP